METEPVSTELKEQTEAFFDLLHGQKTSKVFRGKQHEIDSFVAAFKVDGVSYLGLGFTIVDTEEFCRWGRGPMLHNIIQSWRAMKMLEQVSVIDEITLSACWYASHLNVMVQDQHYLDRLVSDVGEERFQEIRSNVLKQAPSYEELDTMLRILEEVSISVNARELQREITAGRISSNPVIDKLISDVDALRLNAVKSEQERQREKVLKANIDINELRRRWSRRSHGRLLKKIWARFNKNKLSNRPVKDKI